MWLSHNSLAKGAISRYHERNIDTRKRNIQVEAHQMHVELRVYVMAPALG
jgi:hypothetical protein